MKKTKRKILGIVAILIIAIAGFCAYKAVDNQADAVASLTDQIIVKVYDQFPSIQILSPQHQEIVIGAPHTMKYHWENTTRVDFTLSYKGEIVMTWGKDYPYFEPGENPNGDDFHDIYLNDYGEYTLSIKAYGTVAGRDFTDSITIYRLSTNITYVDSDEQSNPNFTIGYEDQIKRVEVQIFDAEGKKVGDPVLLDTIEGDNSMPFTFKMPAGSASGQYRAQVRGFNAEGIEISDPSFTYFEYNSPRKNNPKVPDTGDNTGGFGLSQTDFLITGLLVFVVVAISAVFLLNRKQKQEK